MRTVVLGDTHGRTFWKMILEHENPDRVIFIGDYFDSYEFSAIEQLHNFKEIMEIRGDVIRLIGNHDLSYFPGVVSTCSGYQPEFAGDFTYEINRNKDKLQVAYRMDDFIFSHAGITKTFLYDNRVPEDEFMVDNLNSLFKMRQPIHF